MTAPQLASTVAAVVAAGGAAWLALAGTARPRPVRATSPVRTIAGPEQAVLTRLRVPLSLLAAAAGWAFVGGVLGLVAALAVGAVSWKVLGRAEGPAARRRREALARDLPTGVELLGACLRAGSSLAPALRVVAEALPGPLAEEFRGLHHRLALGTDAATVWADLGRHPQLGPMGRTLARAHETGASVTSAVDRLAEDLRAQALAEVERQARGVDVRASAPLGVCFLPAFLLIGVVPLVAGIFGSMSLFW